MSARSSKKASDEWRVETNEVALKYNYSGEPLINESLSEMSEEQLDLSWHGLFLKSEEKTGKRILGRLYMKLLVAFKLFYVN